MPYCNHTKFETYKISLAYYNHILLVTTGGPITVEPIGNDELQQLKERIQISMFLFKYPSS